MCLILKSTPIVGMKESAKISSQNLERMDDFPTEELPIITTLKR
jgi:hypothetical protein